MTANDIMTSARNILGDSDKTGWEDSRLLELVGEAQEDICMFAHLYRKEVDIELLKDVKRYSLPEDLFVITRTEIGGVKAPIKSRTQNPDMLIKDDLDKGIIELVNAENLPDITGFIYEGFNNEITLNAGIYGLVVDGTPIFNLEGVFTEFDVNYGTPYSYGNVVDTDVNPLVQSIPESGVLVDIGQPGTPTYAGFTREVEGFETVGKFGILVSNLPTVLHLKVFYIAVPPRPTDITDDLIINDMWKQLAIDYVVGVALQDDNQEANTARGEKMLLKYGRRLEKIRKATAKDYNKDSASRETTYRRT